MASFPEKVLLTGGAGFVGRHVAAALASIHPATRLLTARRSADPDCELVLDLTPGNRGSLETFIAREQPRCVIHCAGSLGPDEDELFRCNLQSTRVLIEALASVCRGIPFVHIGSAAEYAELPFGVKTTETSPVGPLNRYGLSKLQATEEVLAATRRGDISGTVLRVFNPIGRGISPRTLFGKIVSFLAEKREAPLILGPLDSYRDYLDIRDVARAVLRAAGAPGRVAGQIVNIGSGRARRTADVVRDIQERTGLRIDHESVAGGSDRSSGMLWQEADVSRAAQLLGWNAETAWVNTLDDLLRAN